MFTRCDFFHPYLNRKFFVLYKNLMFVNNLMSLPVLLNVNRHYSLRRTHKKLMLCIILYSAGLFLIS